MHGTGIRCSLSEAALRRLKPNAAGTYLYLIAVSGDTCHSSISKAGHGVIPIEFHHNFRVIICRRRICRSRIIVQQLYGRILRRGLTGKLLRALARILSH